MPEAFSPNSTVTLASNLPKLMNLTWNRYDFWFWKEDYHFARSFDLRETSMLWSKRTNYDQRKSPSQKLNKKIKLILDANCNRIEQKINGNKPELLFDGTLRKYTSTNYTIELN